MQEENNGITFREIFRTIWLRKWVALIVAVAVALVCSISLYYGYNYRVKNYVMEFSLNLPGEDNGAVYIYPNGSQLYYSDMTSLPTLKAVKNSRESFSDIDVEEMASKGYINIERNVKVLADDNMSTSAIKEITYTITAKASCFSSTSQASDFLAEIANTPVEYLENMKIDYGVYLGNFDKVNNYEKEIELLKNQLEVLTKGYSSLIAAYGNDVVIENNRTLFAYSHDVELYEKSNELENLLTIVQNGHLLKNESCKDSYSLELTRIQERLDDAQTTLDKLTSSANAYIDGASVIKAQQDLVNELTRRKNLVDAFVSGTVDESFEDEIQKALATVQKLTDSYSATSATVYSNASSVVYVQPGIIAAQGGIGLTKVLILSILIAVVVALIAAYVAGYFKMRSLKAAKNSADGAPSDGEESATEKTSDGENSSAAYEENKE